jgi:hypothetical protein
VDFLFGGPVARVCHIILSQPSTIATPDAPAAPDAAPAGPRPPPRWMVVLVFALVLAARLHYAWVLRYSIDADRGIVQLMAAHIAEGRTWPVFFYGQAYMGSLEPLLGALFCYLVGTSAFAVALGTALCAFLVTLVAWRITRAIAGPWAALYACAFFATASPAFSAYMADPRGGYAMALLLGLWCLHQAARLADCAHRGEAVPWTWYGGLGLAAGAAWWTSGIVAPALAAAALVIAIGLRGRIFNLRIVAGFVGFLVGALPWLVWNARRGWISLSMSESLGAVSFADTLPLLARRAWSLLGVDLPDASPYLLGGALLLLLAGALLPSLFLAARGRRTDAIYQALAVLFFLPLFAAAYASSSFARIDTLRYLLPLLPLLGIATGLLLGTCLARVPWPVHLVALALLIGAQPARGRHRLHTDEARRGLNQRSATALQAARAQECDVVFVPYLRHWMNFATREALPFVDPGEERYAPYARRALLAERPGWFAGANGIATFLKSVGSRYESSSASLDTLIHHVQPPDHRWRLLPPDQVRSAIASDGSDQRAALLDGNLATRWREDTSQSQPAHVDLVLAEPTSLCGLKFYSADANYPIYLAVQGRAAGETNWTELLPTTTATGYHWSGGGLYWRNLYHSLEVRFGPATVAEIRVAFPPSPRRDAYRFRLAELSLLAVDAHPAAAPSPSPAAVDDLITRLQRAGIRQLLADRYVSDRVAARTGHGISVRSSCALTRGVNDLPRRDDPPYTPCELGSGLALLLPPGGADAATARLRAAGFAPVAENTPLGVLLTLTAEDDPCAPRPGSMAWFGDALFAWQEEGHEAGDAQRWYEQAEHLRSRQPDDPCARALLEQALAQDPDHVPALQAWLALAGAGDPQTDERRERLRRLTQPERPCQARFANGMEIFGVQVEPARAARGDTVNVTYFWRAPADLDYINVATFVHFRQEKVVWQDDHQALAGITHGRIRSHVHDAPLLVKRRVTIPVDAPAGTYDLALGLVTGPEGHRVKVKGPDAGLRRSVVLEKVLEVTAP